MNWHITDWAQANGFYIIAGGIFGVLGWMVHAWLRTKFVTKEEHAEYVKFCARDNGEVKERLKSLEGSAEQSRTQIAVLVEKATNNQAIAERTQHMVELLLQSQLNKEAKL